MGSPACVTIKWYRTAGRPCGMPPGRRSDHGGTATALLLVANAFVNSSECSLYKLLN